MSRKRLSDLLREEVQKSPESSETDQASQPSSTSASGSQKSRQAAARRTPAKTTPATPPIVTADTSSTPTPDQPPSEPQSETGDALETAIADLKATLETVKANEGVLQRKVEQLEADLAERDALVQSLQKDAQTQATLKSELEEAKRVIVQLTEMNTSMSDELKALKQKPSASVAAVPVAPSAPRSVPSPAKSTSAIRPLRSELERVLQHPVLPAPPSTTLTNDEIGWVD